MNRTDSLKMGLAIQHIAQSVDDQTLKRIDPYLKTIEEIGMKMVKVWDKKVNSEVYDDEHEQWIDVEMTLRDYINAYTDEGLDKLLED